MKKRFKRSQRSNLSWRQRAVEWFLTRPEGTLRLLTGGAVDIDGRRLDPALVAVCRFAGLKGGMHLLEPACARRRASGLSALLPKVHPLMDRIEEREIPGPGGPLPIRIYSPPDLRRSPPALVFFHGGGWVLGDLESSDVFCRLIAGQTPCRVISVDYRLAPEHPYPAAVQDAEAAFRWVWEQAEALGIDRRRIGIGGDSAGGNLAAVVSAELASGECRPHCQFLIYPVTSAAQDTESYRLFAEGFVLERALVDYFYDHYLGPGRRLAQGPDGGATDPKVSPLAAEEFSRLPPTVVATAGFDVLRDEGDAYAEKLKAAGVHVDHRRYPSLMHAFAAVSGLPSARRAIDEVISDLATLFHRGVPAEQGGS
ncbi:MAG: alpha/beta hydrolase [Acidobacteriota bacterium]